MTKEEVFSYIKNTYHVSPDYPWDDENAVLRHKDTKKWFALIMDIQKSRLGFSQSDIISVINLKCDPLLGSVLRTKEGIHPAYHMNKEQWITIRLDGSVSDKEIMQLIDLSFSLTEKKMKNDKGQLI